MMWRRRRKWKMKMHWCRMMKTKRRTMRRRIRRKRAG